MLAHHALIDAPTSPFLTSLADLYGIYHSIAILCCSHAESWCRLSSACGCHWHGMSPREASAAFRGFSGEMMEQAGQVGAIEAAMRLHVYNVFTLMKV